MSLTQTPHSGVRADSRQSLRSAGASACVLGGCAGPARSAGFVRQRHLSAQPATDATKVAAAVAAGVAAGNVASARPGASPASVAQAAGAAAAAATGPKPFAEVIKDAKETPGLFRAWQKDEKVWIEIAPDQFGVPYLFTSNLSRGVGEQGVYGGMMLGDQIVEWKRIGNAVQLIAKNYAFTGGTNAPIAQGVKEGFTDSLLGATTVASQPHPERKTVLIDANALLLTDIPVGERFTTGIHMRSYTFDAKNSSFEAVKNSADQSSFVVSAHYQNPRATLPPSPTATHAESVSAVHHPSRRAQPLSRLHVQLREAAGADGRAPRRCRASAISRARCGIFPPTRNSPPRPTTSIAGGSRRRTRPRRCPSRRSRSSTGSTAPSPKSTAPRCATASSNGTRRSRRSGFKDAIVVKQQDQEGTVDTFDARHSTVRWFVSTDAGFAIGPSTVDPRTGEILNAQVAIPEDWSRVHRTFVSAQVPSAFPAFDAYKASLDLDGRFCTFASDALAETEFGLDVLVERGEIEPGSPEADAFVNASLKAVVMHEVGHTLGLRHNFRASTVYPLAKISDPAWSREQGISGSVMDYTPINIAVKGEAQGAYFEPTIGPYDYWAIEYAYRPLPKETEADELAKIAARGANDPLLAFSSDEEAIAGLDPDASRFDLGSDPILYLQKRLLISQELWQRLQARQLKPGESYDVLRRTFDAGFRQYARSAALTAKYVGGVHYVRDFAGIVAPAADARAAGQAARGAQPHRDRRSSRRTASGSSPNSCAAWESTISTSASPAAETAQFNPDFSLRRRVLGLQVGVLNTLLSDTVLARLQDSEIKVSQADQALTLHELFAALRGSIWSELKTSGSIPGPRRDLQREHLRRIATVLTRPSSTTPSDAIALFREEAKSLSAQIKAACAQRKPRCASRART